MQSFDCQGGICHVRQVRLRFQRSHTGANDGMPMSLMAFLISRGNSSVGLAEQAFDDLTPLIWPIIAANRFAFGGITASIFRHSNQALHYVVSLVSQTAFGTARCCFFRRAIFCTGRAVMFDPSTCRTSKARLATAHPNLISTKRRQSFIWPR